MSFSGDLQGDLKDSYAIFFSQDFALVLPPVGPARISISCCWTFKNKHKV